MSKKPKYAVDHWTELRPKDGVPNKIEVIYWNDTEVHSGERQPANKVYGGLGFVCTTGFIVKETRTRLSLAQSVYIPSGSGYLPHVGEVVTIPKSIIRKRTVIARG
jgi:hypothetical protein